MLITINFKKFTKSRKKDKSDFLNWLYGKMMLILQQNLKFAAVLEPSHSWLRKLGIKAMSCYLMQKA